MPDYKQMYYNLLNETSNAIERLQKAQQRTKELYLSSENTPFRNAENEYSENKLSNHSASKLSE